MLKGARDLLNVFSCCVQTRSVRSCSLKYVLNCLFFLEQEEVIDLFISKTKLQIRVPGTLLPKIRVCEVGDTRYPRNVNLMRALQLTRIAGSHVLQLQSRGMIEAKRRSMESSGQISYRLVHRGLLEVTVQSAATLADSSS